MTELPFWVLVPRTRQIGAVPKPVFQAMVLQAVPALVVALKLPPRRGS